MTQQHGSSARTRLAPRDVLYDCSAKLPGSLGQGLLALLAVWLGAGVFFVLLEVTGLLTTAAALVAAGAAFTWANVAALRAVARIHAFEAALLDALPLSRAEVLAGVAGGVVSILLLFVFPYTPEVEASEGAWRGIEPGSDFEAWTVAFMFIAAAWVIAPIGEELIFRGWLQPALIQAGWNPVLSIATASLLFGVLHPDVAAATASGVIFGLLRHTTGRLTAPMIAHAGHNVIVWIWMLAEEGPYGFSAWL